MNIQLYTDNLIIKKPSKENLNTIKKELNNWKIAQWLVNVPYPYKLEDAKKWLKKTQEDELSFNIFLKNLLIGGISITKKENESKFELGYWIGEDYWGKGYALEACSSLIPYFFSNTSKKKLYAGHMIKNINSKKILETLGFKKISKRKVYSLSKKIDVDDIYYELINS